MVFVHPQHLEFPETFETQTISIFNPHDFTIHFHFESTRPNAFSLSQSEGDILAKHSLEITVKLLDKTITEEKFQVRLTLPGKGKRLGEKIIKVTLKSDRGNDDDGSSTSSSARQRKASKTEHFHFQELSPTGFDKSSVVNYGKLKLEKVPNEYFVYAALVIALVILMLPLDDNSNAQTHLLAVSVNIKLVAAYILGIVTVFLIRN